MIVDANSASPQLPGVTYYGVEACHSQMCKFASTSAPGFRTLATDIREWIADAPDIIQGRWKVEEEENNVRDRSDLRERMSPMVSSSLALGSTE